MTPERVRFSSHRFLFRVSASQCASVECECGHVTFVLDEDSDGEQFPSSPMRIRICVDPQTWLEVDPPQRAPAIEAIVQEFLRDYPEKQREAFKTAARRKSDLARRLREYRINPREAEQGKLIPWGEIASDRDSDYVDASYFFDYFKHDGTEYVLDDMYCSNPDCDCREVHLVFMKFQRAKQPEDSSSAEDIFGARISLDGELKIDKAVGCTRDQASTIAAAWQAGFDELDELKWRYDKVKQIARRTYVRRPAALPPPSMSLQPLRNAGHLGRNDPCPCGSGKKYKKCCGR